MLKVQENYTKSKKRKDKNIQTNCPKMISANTRETTKTNKRKEQAKKAKSNRKNEVKIIIFSSINATNLIVSEFLYF